jgi:hypothetical protein
MTPDLEHRLMNGGTYSIIELINLIRDSDTDKKLELISIQNARIEERMKASCDYAKFNRKMTIGAYTLTLIVFSVVLAFHWGIGI